MPGGPGSDLLIKDKSSSVGCSAAVAMDFSLAGADAVCLANCASAIAERFWASACSGDELKVVPTISWRPAADGSVFGCAGGSTAGVDLLTGLVRDWLIRDKASGVGCGATVVLDLSFPG